MIKKYAIVAHYDIFNEINNNFKLVLSSLEIFFDQIVVVSTSKISNEKFLKYEKVKFITRPNIGYDFYSYKVGYEYLNTYYEAGNTLLINSSFYVVNCKIFENTISDAIVAISNNDIVGLTESTQFGYHLQNYFIFINKNIIRDKKIYNFFKNIQPQNSKIELILKYELGFSKLFMDMRLTLKALYKPTYRNYLTMYLDCFLSFFQTLVHKDSIATPVPGLKNINPSQYFAAQIASEKGIVKSEVLRSNPLGLNLKSIQKKIQPEIYQEIKTLVNKSQPFYRENQDGLTNIVLNQDADKILNLIHFGTHLKSSVRIAVVLHLFYIDLLDEFAYYLRNIKEPFDIFISTPFEGDIPKIINLLSKISSSVTVYLCKNQGRDIGPFISLYLSGIFDNYMVVLKLHSKKSLYSPKGSEWRNKLVQKLVGNPVKVREIIKSFEFGGNGILGPYENYLTNEKEYWGANFEKVKEILISIDNSSFNKAPKLRFFAGSMFWFSPKAFENLRKIPKKLIDFEIENGKQDGTLAHAYERVFCILVESQGFRVSTVELPWAGVNQRESHKNHLPVLTK
jgi:rhamnosyltransferase